MKTEKNGCQDTAKSSALAAWISKHRYGCLQGMFLCLTVVSLVWMLFYGDASDYDDRGVLVRYEGYGFAFVLPFIVCMVFFSHRETCETHKRKWDRFIFTVLWGYLFISFWCSILEISYLFPIAAAACITGLYKKIQPNDKYTTNLEVVLKTVIIWGISFLAAGFFSSIGLEESRQEQEYIRRAGAQPIIELVDVRDNYIFTKEFGLEQTTKSAKISKGSKIHRLPTEDGKVFILAE